MKTKIASLGLHQKKEVISDILKQLNGFSYDEALGILDSVQSRLRDVAIVKSLPEAQEDNH